MRSQVRRLCPEREGRYPRLYALGIDAFMYAPYLRGPGLGMFNRHAGVTGTLSLDPERRVHRGLQWAVVEDGIVQALPPSAGTIEPEDFPSQELRDDAPATENGPSAGDPG